MLRGINLGARNRVSMADLRTLVEKLGGQDVRTYVVSGNVVFESSQSADELAGAIQKGITEATRLTVDVLVRTPKELATVAATRPFPNADPAFLYVTFLAETPASDHLAGIDATRFEPDEFRLIGRELFLHCPNGYGNSRLTNGYFEKKLGMAATTRNWRTVNALTEMANPRR